MKRLLTLVAFFATLQASAQQVNPVPDYVFSNRMSAGRNTVTDTGAYFSIGPRYGATRGMMPPMVVDTASFSGNRRNGLLIFSVQKNKFLYWDSVGVKWAEMAGTAGTALTSADTAALLSTRAWRQKGIDSLNIIKLGRSDTAANTYKYANYAFASGGPFDAKAESIIGANIAGTAMARYTKKGIDSFLSLSNPILINQNNRIYAADPLTKSNDVNVAPYYGAFPTTANWAAGTTSFQNLVATHQARFRQSGDIRKVIIYIATLTNLDSLFITIWRKTSGTTYDLVATSENLKPSLTVGLNTVDCFISGIKEGDYYGVRVKQTGTWNGLAAIENIPNDTTFYKADVATWTSGHNTNSDNQFGFTLPVGFLMRAPMAIFIGNSITQGIPLNSAFTQTQFLYYDRSTYFGAMVADSLNWTYQNMGKGSDNMNEIRTRFQEDVVNKYPRYVFIEGGINSILQGFSVDSILKDWAAVIDMSIANNIVPIISTILPCNNCTSTEMNKRDTLNAYIIQHTANKPVILIKGISDSLGKFRAGGPAGNLWDFKTGYNADPYHLNTTGSRVYANTILASLKNLMVNGQISTGSLNAVKVISDSLKLQNKGVLTITGNDSIKATIMLSDAGTELLLKTIYSNPIIFQVNNSERARINTNGELIINTSGTDAGDYKLQVTGNIYNTGSITTGAPSGGSIKPWKIGEAATVSPTSPNRTIRIEIDGVVYYLHAKTTND